MNEFEKCIEERRLIRINASDEMIEKELYGAEYDLMRAEESLHNEDYKWASVQAYYSMFHAAKALVFKKGYREKSHNCLLIAIRELYVRTNELEHEFADNLEMSMDLRHEADYGLTYDEESAKITVENAKKLLAKTQTILKSQGM
ncbi:MAG: hypothetical protein CVT88_02295 [Candidatus Altiarchaeales archaeon HGW-Altiarchaeales-1]|nr:MAG: hypothetical protein CVT88_02295 [Candidatus Altiarchaeales archaeon HGW-Altiarchaeales-1]